MAAVNKVILVGNLGKDPEIRSLPNGSCVANIIIATSERYKDRDTGENKEITEWHRVVFFNRLAEIVQQYLRKGASIYVEGKLRTRKWQGQDGIERYSTEIVCDQMQMLGGKSSQSSSEPFNSAPYQDEKSPQISHKDNASSQKQNDSKFDDFDDDIPF